MRQISGYVLIGGKSSRMGTDKFALRLNDETFAERAVKALRKITDRVYFVAAKQKTEHAALLPPDVPLINDVLPDKAALGGIYTAITHSKSDWIAVLACDLPFVSGDLLVRLAKISENARPNVSVVAPLQPDNRIQPLCAFYRVETCLPIAARLLKNGEIPPVRRLLAEASTQFIAFEQFNDLPSAHDFFRNINTPEELLEAQKIKSCSTEASNHSNF